jgi:ribosomal protein L32E
MKQTTATRRAASVFHRTVARDQFSIEESTTEDRARREKGLNGQVRDRLIAPTRVSKPLFRKISYIEPKFPNGLGKVLDKLIHSLNVKTCPLKKEILNELIVNSEI